MTGVDTPIPRIGRQSPRKMSPKWAAFALPRKRPNPHNLSTFECTDHDHDEN